MLETGEASIISTGLYDKEWVIVGDSLPKSSVSKSRDTPQSLDLMMASIWLFSKFVGFVELGNPGVGVCLNNGIRLCPVWFFTTEVRFVDFRNTGDFVTLDDLNRLCTVWLLASVI